jgi:RNA polymerase sigma factor (sigma-70 family)
MQVKSDAELLREYAAQASEAAFREIVTRHADLVYASALRQARSPELARDIAQTVFADLVRKAPALGQSLAENASLVGWLYRSTRFEAHTQLRDDRRRQARERQAMENFDATPETATEWARVGPVLDEAMADLSDEDREALLLRFFKNHDFRTIGLSLGVSDDTAQKRVSRALERLRAEFHRRGVTTTAVALSTALSANAVSEGPAGLAAALSTAALTGTTIANIATATAIKTIAMTTLQKTIIGATLAAAVGTGIYEARQVSTLRSQVQSLQQQQAPFTEQVQQLTHDRDDATSKLAALRDENERLKRNTTEMLKLRGEVSLLRRQTMNLGEASYGGRMLNEWLQNYDTNRGDLYPEAQNAVRRMGDKSIPTLLKLLREADDPAVSPTPWMVSAAFKVLGQSAKAAVPDLVEILQTARSEWVRAHAADSLMLIGTDARAAIPALITALGDKESALVRNEAVGALNRIGGSPTVIMPILFLGQASRTDRQQRAELPLSPKIRAAQQHRPTTGRRIGSSEAGKPAAPHALAESSFWAISSPNRTASLTAALPSA